MKRALVTGANKGIGREGARQLARKGFHVFVGARNRAAGCQAADEIAREGGKATFLELDVASHASVTAAARQFEKIADHLDVLVNNAGIIVDGDDSILEISDDQMRQTLETNTLGALRVTRAFLPFLKKSKTPRIINVSSGGGQLTGGADGWAPAYCVSKTALNGITSRLAAHGHGRAGRDSFGGERCRHDCLAGWRSAAESYREIPARSQRDTVVNLGNAGFWPTLFGIVPSTKQGEAKR